VRIVRGLDLRYAGQSYELHVPADGRGLEAAALRKRFHELHDLAYGYADPGRAVEVVNARVRAVGETEKPPPEPIRGGGKDGSGALVGRPAIVFGGKKMRGSLYDRARLRAGDRFEGPSLIAEFSGTSFLPPGWRCRVDALGNLLLEPAQKRRGR
ncbi:MAG: hydantoinase/oxoprolinase family protein, partial [Nitrospinota bacterium]